MIVVAECLFLLGITYLAAQFVDTYIGGLMLLVMSIACSIRLWWSVKNIDLNKPWWS